MKKIISLIIVAVMLVSAFSLTSCGKQDQSLEGIKKSGKLVVYTEAGFAPFEFIYNNKVVGVDIAICEEIAKEIGVELVVEDVAFNTILGAIESGKAAIGAAGITITDERKDQVDFSIPYTTSKQYIIVKADSTIKSYADLAGKKIGVQSGTTGDIYCAGDYGEDAVARYDNGALAVQALTNGQVDCVVIDNEPAKAFVEANEGLKILETEYITEEYAAAISKENTELLDKFNTALSELKADGKIDEIVGKYIKAE